MYLGPPATPDSNEWVIIRARWHADHLTQVCVRRSASFMWKIQHEKRQIWKPIGTITFDGAERVSFTCWQKFGGGSNTADSKANGYAANNYSTTSRDGKQTWKQTIIIENKSPRGVELRFEGLEKRQQRAERRRENEKGEVREETWGESGTAAKSTSRLVKALQHTHRLTD